MKKALVFLTLALTFSAFAETTAKDISNLRIPGERVIGRCAKYAFCLNYVLFKRGIESRAIAYRWHARRPSHAIVLFKLGEQWYAIDNEQDKAVPVHGDTDLALAKSFDKDAISLQLVPFYHGRSIAPWMKALAKAKP